MLYEYKMVLDYPTCDGDKDDVIERAVGRPREGSGAGFGRRDMEWFFDDAEAAATARDRAVAVLPGGSSIALFHREEDDEAWEDYDG